MCLIEYINWGNGVFLSFFWSLTDPTIIRCLWTVRSGGPLKDSAWGGLGHGPSQSCRRTYLLIHLLSEGLIVKSRHRRLSRMSEETSIGSNAKALCVMYCATMQRNHTYDPLHWLWLILVSKIYLNDIITVPGRRQAKTFLHPKL